MTTAQRAARTDTIEKATVQLRELRVDQYGYWAALKRIRDAVDHLLDDVTLVAVESVAKA